MIRSNAMKIFMNVELMLRRYLIQVAFVALAVLLLGNDTTLAREDEQRKSSDGIEQHSPSPNEQKPINGYPVRKRYVGGPTDVEWDLDNSFPKEGSVLELILRCNERQHR